MDGADDRPGQMTTPVTALDADAMPSLRCRACGMQYPAQQAPGRCSCGGLLDLDIAVPSGLDRDVFTRRLASHDLLDRSGVWRYREFLVPLPSPVIVTRPEGNTNLYPVPRIAQWAGCAQLWLKHEGENPTGSFKDRGMTVAVSHARWIGARAVACASTGNTSASVAAYAALAGLPAVVFLPEGKITAAKLGQAIAYGARIVQIRGDFDAAMRLVQEASAAFGLYLLNSVNPFRLLGQQTIMFEMLHQLAWDAPDWIVLPGGNLGNTAAFGQALVRAHAAGLIARLPRLATVQAEGAAPFYAAFQRRFTAFSPVQAETIATAIRIGNPVNYERARDAIVATDGVVTAVSDAEILEAKAMIDRAGIGCEPASAAAVAGLRRLISEGVIDAKSNVVAVLTGHVLKDPETIMAMHQTAAEPSPAWVNRPIVVEPTLAALREVLDALA
ncbi:threonine synthase [Thermorudis peleae]|uniref:threonine synthase n=1 Tax=Thermorudis peleae TaxID=1382356 RepID=UPI000B20613A|nr:threonine synthase [Thermorudis peleae]